MFKVSFGVKPRLDGYELTVTVGRWRNQLTTGGQVEGASLDTAMQRIKDETKVSMLPSPCGLSRCKMSRGFGLVFTRWSDKLFFGINLRTQPLNKV